MGFITNSEASKEERWERGIRTMLERFFCTIRRADFMPFPAKPRLTGRERTRGKKCGILKQEQILNSKASTHLSPFLIKITVVS